VDDDPRLLRALTDLLEAHGHSVTSAASGAAALTTFDPGFVDLVVTDLGMPGMTGWEVAAEVKSRAPHLPVFLLTGWGERVAADDRSRFVDRVIAKPVSADALLGPLTAIARSDLRSSA
jgi:CheY-like chemotaxis protein